MKEGITITKVSIIIPFYNCSYIDQAIESALNQTYPYIEVIVVNDGSTKYTEKITPYLKDIRYFEKENGGTASALNLGILNATGEYFAWLSSDDLFMEEKISKQLTFMEQTNASFSYTNYSLIDSEKAVLKKSASIQYTNKLRFLEQFRRGCPINGCTVMMKMELFTTLGLFNENLKFTQDYDYWLRAVQHYELFYLNEPLLQYRVHDEMGTRTFNNQIAKEVQALKKKYDPFIVKLINRYKR
ncbi:glycosyltransferase [Mesobacillus maritimus]|uniref:glycosyltransferase n=1 Tax=Mesobacillus maritimus TaxID=1643336 RepID=UPI003850144B